MIENFQAQPLSLKGILSLSWFVFRKHLRYFATLALLVYLPINLVLYFIPFEEIALRYGDSYAYQAYMRANQLMQVLFGVFAVMAIIHFVNSLVLGKVCAVKESFGATFRKWGSVFWAGVLSKLAVIGFTLLLIVPGIIYAGYYIFVLYTVVLTDNRGLKSLEYSKKLVKGRWWKMVGYAIVIHLCGVVGYILTGFISFFFAEIYWLNLILDTLGDLASIFTVIGMTLLFIKVSEHNNTIDVKVKVS